MEGMLNEAKTTLRLAREAAQRPEDQDWALDVAQEKASQQRKKRLAAKAEITRRETIDTLEAQEAERESALRTGRADLAQRQVLGHV